MIGNSCAYLETVRLLRRIAQFDTPVLIEGETGTGKEVAAREIHYLCSRAEHSFIPVNCGTLPDALIENELFGHRRGAYTDARADFPGLLGLAHRGTLLLDEIDALTAKAQVALLRFLQDQQFRPLGGTGFVQADVRIIVASNRSLAQLVEQGRFREDLYYRLNILYVRMPPLRERAGDIRLLAEYFIAQLSKRYGLPEKKLHPSTLQWLDHYAWPGNVRELENFIAREFLLAESPEIVYTGSEGIAPSHRRHDGAHYQKLRTRVLEEFDVNYLRKLLSRHHGNVTHAANEAGKERRALGKLLKKYGINPNQYR